MGYADRPYSYRPGRRGPGSGDPGSGGPGLGSIAGGLTPWVRRLLIANGAVYLLMAVRLLPVAWTVRTFGFSPGDLLVHPWSPVTYMFLHGGFWHLFVNMLVLFFFGPPLERAWGGVAFLKYYVVAGLGGALFSLFFLPLPAVGAGTTVIGASGAIFGIMLAFALLWPDAQVYIWGIFPMRAKWFVGLLGAFTVLASFSGGGGNVAHWAHLGGLVTGFTYLRFGERLAKLAEDAARRFRSDGDGEETARQAPRRATREGSRDPNEEDRDGFTFRKRSKGDALDEVDRILDKIRDEGIDSLTEKERAFLDEMSRRFRG